MPIAVIAFDFDPFLRFGDRAIRWETVALAGSILAVLGLAALIAGRTPAGPPVAPAVGAVDTETPDAATAHLRRDDLLFIVLGIVPGAVIGGRLGYVLLHLDFYAARPGAIVDPGQGSLQLSVALVVGAITGTYVARLLEGPVRAWLHVAVVPLLLGLVLGKGAMALGGSGQGVPSDAGPATAYLGSGPWGSLDPATPALAAQLLEAGLTVLVLLAMWLLLASGRFRSRDGRAFLVAAGLWAVARFAVAFTWRDPAVLGPLRADQLISLAIAVGCVALIVARGPAKAPSVEVGPAGDERSALEWPDPSDRPTIRPVEPSGGDRPPSSPIGS